MGVLAQATQVHAGTGFPWLTVTIFVPLAGAILQRVLPLVS